jgi:DNA-directed RNA polymerase specialized sigma54-like protein
MSDEAIVAHLRKTGMKLARRTIAKYRKALKIGRASLRKYIE